MKVIVKVSGFYGGTWHDAADQPQDMPDAVARQFLPPHGDQLALPAKSEASPAEKPAPAKRSR
ncbi:MAG: hypothetical protein AB7H71_18585 [Alphaproteobacteria bacterium]